MTNPSELPEINIAFLLSEPEWKSLETARRVTERDSTANFYLFSWPEVDRNVYKVFEKLGRRMTKRIEAIRNY